MIYMNVYSIKSKSNQSNQFTTSTTPKAPKKYRPDENDEPDYDQKLLELLEVEFEKIPDQKNIICKVCGKEFRKYIQRAMEHSETHLTSPRNCRVCGKTSKNRSMLRYHMRRRHDIK